MTVLKKEKEKKGSPREAKKPPNLPLPIRKDWKEKNKEPKEKLVCHYPKKKLKNKKKKKKKRR